VGRGGASFSSTYAKHHSAEPVDYCIVSFVDHPLEGGGFVALGAQRARRMVYCLFDRKHAGDLGNPIPFYFQPEKEAEKSGSAAGRNV